VTLSPPQGNANPRAGSGQEVRLMTNISERIVSNTIGGLAAGIMIGAAVKFHNHPAAAIGPVIAIIGLLGLYLFPTAIAAEMDSRNLLAIFILNVFLGWTVLGWIIALSWAVKR
jgi:Superinfection immunity protein